MTTIHDPGGTGAPINELWAYVCEHAPGDEGILAVSTPAGTFAAVASDRERVERIFGDFVQEAAAQTGKTMRLVRFHGREDIEVVA